MFFAKLAASLALFAPLVSALGIATPFGWTSAGPATLNWTAVNGDPQTFSIELTNNAFNRQFALANNVETGAMSISFTLPRVPASDSTDYTIQFVDIGNATNVYAESAQFAIGEEVSSTTSSSSTASRSASSSAVSASLTSSHTTSGFGTTRSVAASSATGTGASTGTNSAVIGSSTAFNSGAVALGLSNTNLASFVVMVVAAIAGAGFVGF